jgi:hypothetical protein
MTGNRGTSDMKTKLQLLGLSLVLSLLVILPATVGAESAVPLGDKGKKIVEKIQDIELMRRNIEECYYAERGVRSEERIVRLSGPNHAGLDGALLNRVFRHLAGTPEYERFVTEYRKLIQRPDYRRLHTDELFAEYLRLLESGRVRFLTQLKEWQAGSAEECAAPGHEGPTQPLPMKEVTFGHPEASQRTESGRAATLEGVLMNHHVGLLKGPRSDTRKKLKVPEQVGNGLGPWWH